MKDATTWRCEHVHKPTKPRVINNPDVYAEGVAKSIESDERAFFRRKKDDAWLRWPNCLTLLNLPCKLEEYQHSGYEFDLPFKRRGTLAQQVSPAVKQMRRIAVTHRKARLARCKQKMKERQITP